MGIPGKRSKRSSAIPGVTYGQREEVIAQEWNIETPLGRISRVSIEIRIILQSYTPILGHSYCFRALEVGEVNKLQNFC
jgi:hypothetical protein